jgi:nicotinamidase-related amidase
MKQGEIFMKIALLIVDMQVAYVGDCAKETGVETACEYINYVSGKLRSKGHCVVHIQHQDEGEDRGDEKLKVIPGIEAAPEDKIVWKNYSNGFWRTELEDLLRAEQVDLVVVSGYSAEFCVTFTYNGARERDFKAVILKGGIVSLNKQAVSDVYRDRELISYPVIDAIIGA